MSKWNMIFDVARCNSCNNCVLSTKDEYHGNRFEGYSEPAPKLGDLWFTLERKERGKAPMIDVAHYIATCQQCDNAPCINADTAGAVSKRADGIVVIDPNAAKGRRDLVDHCPYGQIFWNEEAGVPQKYSFDAHLLDAGWKEPRAVQACPTRALTMAKLDDAAMAVKADAEGLVNLRPELGTKPRIWYRNLGRVTDAFLGGSLVRMRDGGEECATGLAVRLLSGGQCLAEQSSDAFGDFRFDGLPGQGEAYTIQVQDAGGTTVFEGEFQLEESRFVGLIEVA